MHSEVVVVPGTRGTSVGEYIETRDMARWTGTSVGAKTDTGLLVRTAGTALGQVVVVLSAGHGGRAKGAV